MLRITDNYVAPNRQQTDASNATTRRPYKKQHLLAATDIDTTPPTNHLARLPLEMLHEVLSWTAPPDILALSRTSRYFCAMLISDPKIWRDARKRFRPYPIPDPSSNWTESAYIAFIFDEKHCEICKRKTFRTPISYSLRAFICYNSACEKAWPTSLINIEPIASQHLPLIALQTWLPYHEVSTSTHIVLKAYARSVWEAALERHKESMKDSESYAIIQMEYARKAARLPQIMKHAKELGVWGDKFEEWRKTVNDANIKFLRGKAKKEMWEIQDFVNTPLYRSLRKIHNKTFELITQEVYEPAEEQFRKEVVRRGEARIRRTIENTARLNREDLRRYWNKLKTTAKDALPPYSEFRHFNIVKSLERKNTTEAAARAYTVALHSVRDELKTNIETQVHIDEEIDVWLKKARKTLAMKLGDPYSFLATIQEHIHTVDRVTAWFQCSRCNKVGRSRLEDQAMTFANVCTHQCPGISRAARLECPWDVRFFEADSKAVAAAKELLRVCELDERSTKKKHLDAFGCRFLCKSCEDPIVMDASSVIGHCKRHERMTLKLLTQKQADATLAAPLERGLVSKLMGPGESSEPVLKYNHYACRHCDRRPLTFDGLRSHLKTKHLIEQVRDEDLMQVAKKTIPKSI